MELHEKLQELRGRKGLTQEELATALFVSRTAVSKWESGRGLPNIDSLKAIARFFSVSVDDLLSGDDLLTLAETDQKERDIRLLDPLFGLFDCGMALLLFLPFFTQTTDGHVQDVSLWMLTAVSPYLNVLYLTVVIGAVLTGVLTLALQTVCWPLWLRCKRGLSLFWSIAGVSLFILSRQPYAAIFTFLFLLVKAWITLRRR